MKKFSKGGRVKLSSEGVDALLDYPRRHMSADCCGTVVYRPSKNRQEVAVKWDGKNFPEYISSDALALSDR
jgi:hypothetical protein